MDRKTDDKKQNRDLKSTKSSYLSNQDNVQIKFEYAKLLIMHNKKKNAKQLLLELLNTSNKEYAMLELGRLEKEEGNIDLARKYFLNLLNTSNKEYAMLELGKLEKEAGNINKAREYFSTLLSEKNQNYAMLELAILEIEEGNIDKARMYFKQLIDIEDNSRALNQLILLEIKEKNYKTALNYINEALKKGIKISFNSMLYLSKKLNIFFDINYEDINYSYFSEQILNYNELSAKNYVFNQNIEIGLNLKYSKDVNPNYLFKIIKPKLVKENKMKKLQFNDIYVVPFNKFIGNTNGYLLVETLPNTTYIVSAYPIYSRKKAYYYLKKYKLEEVKSLKR